MSDNTLTRRDTLAALGALGAQDPHSHPPPAAAAKTTGPYKPKVFNERDYKTLAHLCALIIPADEVSGSALDGGAPAYIDLLCSGNEKLKETFLSGLAWLDHTSVKRTGKPFLESSSAEQTALLDLIAYRKNDGAELGPGIRFFDWARRLTVDAFYTSAAGIKDVGYQGNKGMTQFKVPQEAIDYVLKRSPLG
ncbi:MAG: gluconate 2-dehydrogenase subunit 3 family protein [Bryobacterales bacterium]|nr:gluconate 2-dehydrogenase subunit 3 family protein [Bryobacterales bacterium]